jgi:hypothetical protein
MPGGQSHPALSPSSAIALTLRAVGGLTTAEIANAFLVPEATMAQRIRRKTSGARGCSRKSPGLAVETENLASLPEIEGDMDPDDSLILLFMCWREKRSAWRATRKRYSPTMLRLQGFWR